MADVMPEKQEQLIEAPARDEIAGHYLADETALVNELLKEAKLSKSEDAAVVAIAKTLVNKAREKRRHFGGIDAFMHEYGLTSEEGVILMCLAEALLRIPDAKTADKLIADKIPTGDWAKHLGTSASLFVNASTWGLMLTGRVIDLGDEEGPDISSILKRMASRSGEPVIREAMRHAMRLLGRHFVLGQTIEEALERAQHHESQGYSFSYDMLGEAAVTAADAERYFNRYRSALEAVAKEFGQPMGKASSDIFYRPSLSIKLSALHPRFEPSKEQRIRRELVPGLIDLTKEAMNLGIAVTIDAEEANRLDLTLQIFADILLDPAFERWNGLGLAVQAYGKRALPTLTWLGRVAESSGKRIPVRLVKGAYWDSEVKFAQEQGLSGYPVFTRKANTDVSYIACAKSLLESPRYFFPQFATHNARTIATVATLAGKSEEFEFQRLHGMGEGIYEHVISENGMARSCRIYAPVGGHEDLLAYLVRRLLENGANTSFVNRLADDQAPISEIIADPADRVARRKDKSHPLIPLPRNIFKPERVNSQGLPLWEKSTRENLAGEIIEMLKTPMMAAPIINGEIKETDSKPITSPHDRRNIIGVYHQSKPEHIEDALAAAQIAQEAWDQLGGAERSERLEMAANLFEENRACLMATMVREAGKTLEGALGDVREAADFLRYYAAQSRKKFSRPLSLKSPTGESNHLSLHGRGVFACISPWNFPLAIFTGQVAAALAAGNSVIAKPAEQTPTTAFEAVKLLHLAGVPSDVLQLLPGAGETVGAGLIADQRLSGVAFTGSNETASIIQKTLAERSGAIIPLIAETGGINAMIVDSSALPEQVVRDAVRSAFDSTGQRCSALRVLFLQDDVSGKIIDMLTGAMEELKIGDPLDYETDIGPVIDKSAQKELETHKSKMQRSAKELINLTLPEDCRHGTYVTPAAYEIESTSVLSEEVFGPILHVIRFDGKRLEQVCRAINQLGYGLTLGLHSRIEETADFVARKVKIGNFYVNRNQIGAVVGVQPFGGEGLSGTGPKAGGPNYLPRFAVERVRTTNLTASGGNATLLSLHSQASYESKKSEEE